MTYPQVISRRMGWYRPHVAAGLAHDPALGDTMTGLLKLSHGRGLRQRWRGLVQMIRGYRRLGKAVE